MPKIWFDEIQPIALFFWLFIKKTAMISLRFNIYHQQVVFNWIVSDNASIQVLDKQTTSRRLQDELWHLGLKSSLFMVFI